jgi:hypothetical protein
VDKNHNNTLSGGISFMQKIQHGKATVTVTPNAVSTLHVTFPEPFDNVPDIQVSAWSSAVGIYFKGVTFVNPTKDGFDIAVYRTESTATVVHWQAINEELYDGKQYFDYALVNGQWCWAGAAGEIPYSKANTDVYTEQVIYFTQDYFNPDQQVFIKAADKSKFVPLATVSSHNPSVVDGGKTYTSVTVYNRSKMKVYNTGWSDITSKFDFVGAVDIDLYLTPNTGGTTDAIYHRSAIKVEKIHVSYSTASGKADKVFYGDGVSGPGYVETFGFENYGVNGEFFMPYGG